MLYYCYQNNQGPSINYKPYVGGLMKGSRGEIEGGVQT